MIKSVIKVDEIAVKKEIEAQTDWSAYCPVCKKQITGTLNELRKHSECHND